MKLSAREEAFCKMHNILPEYFEGKKNRSKLTEINKSLIKQIYVSYHELMGVYGDVTRFHNGFYTKFIERFGAEAIPFKYDPKYLDFTADLMDILREISSQLQYFQMEAFTEMKTHMKMLSDSELYTWVIKLKNQAPADNAILLLKVKGLENGFAINPNLNTAAFGEGIKNLKANPSKDVSSVEADPFEEYENRTVWLGFIPDLHTTAEIKEILSSFYGSPSNTDVTWI